MTTGTGTSPRGSACAYRLVTIRPASTRDFISPTGHSLSPRSRLRQSPGYGHPGWDNGRCHRFQTRCWVSYQWYRPGQGKLESSRICVHARLSFINEILSTVSSARSTSLHQATHLCKIYIKSECCHANQVFIL